MTTIQELLYNRGLDKNAEVKLVRHKDASCDLYEKYRTNQEWFFAYQSSQANPVFKDTDYIVSFIGEEGVSSRFIGVYQVSNEQEKSTYSPYPSTGETELIKPVIIIKCSDCSVGTVVKDISEQWEKYLESK